MLTPDEHYAQADRLMERVAGMEPSLQIARTLTQQALVHATLAQCPDWYSDTDEAGNGYTTYPRLETREATGDRL